MLQCPLMATDDPEIIERLKTVHLFRAAMGADLSELAPLFRRASYAPGQAVVREGDHGHHFYIVDQGQADVVVRMRGAGKDRGPGAGSRRSRRQRAPVPTRHLATLRPGDYFG